MDDLDGVLRSDHWLLEVLAFGEHVHTRRGGRLFIGVLVGHLGRHRLGLLLLSVLEFWMP